MKAQKIVFIVIPARNEEKFIIRTLDAIANQTLPPENVSTVDDGSPDPELLEETKRLAENKRFFNETKESATIFGIDKVEILDFPSREEK
ncbi:MAG: glycosyltransferase [Candidatus Hodarchaeales archaeon]